MHNLKKTDLELEEIGFYFNEKGEIKGPNENKFARYILENLQLIYVGADRFYLYKDGRWNFVERNLLSRKIRKLLHECVADYWSVSLETKYMEALKREAPFVEKLDSKRNYINLKNGMLELKSLELEKHSPIYNSSIQVPIVYNSEAKCPNFKRFLKDVFEGDKERINVVQEMMGYCLTAETSAQKAFFLFGKGANGKSILAEVLLHLCGKGNTSAVPLKELENAFQRYEIVDKLLNLATENEISERGLNTTHFKAIVAGDPIQVERKFEQSFLYQPICKLVFLLNNLPYSKDRSWGFQRRLIVIPFNKVFREDDPNTMNYKDLLDSLLGEMDGILNFALRGLKRLRNNNYKFSYSKAVEEVLKEYREMVNPYHAFVDEKIIAGNESDRINSPDLVRIFKRWCGSNGHQQLAKSSNRKIIQEVRDVLKDIKIPYDAGDKCKSRGIRYTAGIKWKVEVDDDEDEL